MFSFSAIDLITSRTLSDENQGNVESHVKALELNLNDFSALKDLSCVKDNNFNFKNKK